MTDFVLVHGAWAGAWCWERTAADLRSAGHHVLVADLTGLGNRAKQAHPGITLSDHVQDVIEQIEDLKIDRFVLVGHSYGGMVVTGVAAELGARIDALVYIDAFVPADGESLWDLTGEWEHKVYIDGQRETPGLTKPLPGLEHPRLTNHPLLTLLEPVRHMEEVAKVQQFAYIFATGWQPTPFKRFADVLKNKPGWAYHEVATSHDVMNEQPEQLRDILLGYA